MRISAPSPLTARASAIRSRTCGRQRLAFLAVSATGGARKPTVQGALAFRLVLQAEKTEGLYPRQGIASTPNFDSKPKSVLCGGGASAPSEEGAGAPKGFRGATEGEIPRACCLPRGVDEHGAKKRSFAFAIVYIKCFRTYSVYLSLRLPAQIIYAGIHLPPQREARALPRREPKLTASERKIVTKETHQGCVFVQVAFALRGAEKRAP